MQFGRQMLEAFSARLLALDRLPADLSPSRLMSEGLAGLRSLVPFDAAWWGESSGGMDGLAPRNWLSGRVNLSADFARDWNRIGAADRFANESMRRLDTVVCETGYADPEPAVEAFAGCCSSSRCTGIARHRRSSPRTTCCSSSSAPT
jgi:hypothetical protein